jgi:ferredoxin
MKRKIIMINEDKCDGCGLCIPDCPEGALQIIDKKARLVSDLLCDGLGACIGQCPKGAIKVVEREAEAYDERKVMESIVTKGANTIKAHLKHLRDHDQKDFLAQALDFLKEKGIDNPLKDDIPMEPAACGCPGGQIMDFTDKPADNNSCCPTENMAEVKTQLRQWPVQMHLISPMAPYFKKADVVLAADCAAYAYGNFHNDFIKGKKLIIACPKLDNSNEVYTEKIKSLIEDSEINTLTVITMEVPCCFGLLTIAKEALKQSSRKIPVKNIVIGIEGGIISEDWV